MPPPLNNKLRTMGPSLVSKMEILKMNKWPMKFAHPMLTNGAWHRAWSWMNEWVNSPSTTHPPLTIFTNILSQATAQLKRRQKAQSKELWLLHFCFSSLLQNLLWPFKARKQNQRALNSKDTNYLSKSSPWLYPHNSRQRLWEFVVPVLGFDTWRD